MSRKVEFKNSVPLSDLRESATGALVFSDEQITAMAKHIESVSQLEPIVCDDSGTILCGTGWFRALKQLGRKTADHVSYVHNLTPAQAAALEVLDVEIANYTGWLKDKLRTELEEILLTNEEIDSLQLSFSKSDLFEKAELKEKKEPPPYRTLTIKLSEDESVLAISALNEMQSNLSAVTSHSDALLWLLSEYGNTTN